MKRSYLWVVVAFVIVGFPLNFHIIRMENEVDIIPKNNMSMRETYLDVRDWGPVDYLSHSRRVRNYLIYEKKYESLVEGIRETADEASKSIKHRLRPIGIVVHRWLSERLN